MTKHLKSRVIPLPRGWSRNVRSAVLHVITLAQYVAAYTRGWAIDGRIARLRWGMMADLTLAVSCDEKSVSETRPHQSVGPVFPRRRQAV